MATEAEKKAAEEAAAKKKAEEAAAKEAEKAKKVTFLGMRHFTIGQQQFHFNRGDIANFDPEQLKSVLIEGKDPGDKNGDFVRGAVNMKEFDRNKKK